MASYTVMLLLACLAGHPDRCHRYDLATDAPPWACRQAAEQWLADRKYLVPVSVECRLEAGA